MRRSAVVMLVLLLMLSARAYADQPAETPTTPATTTPATPTPSAPTPATPAPVVMTGPMVTPPLVRPSDAPREPRRKPGPHEGVMWRLMIGGAYTHGWSQTEGMSRTVSALSGTLSVSLGHSISKSFALHLDLLAARSGSATYSSDGTTIADDVDLTAVLLGVGATYWISPYDIFVTAGIGLSQMSTVSGTFRVVVEVPDIDSTGVGFGLQAAIGKQWRVANKWGIGPALQLWLTSAPQTVDADRLKLFGAALSLSLTFD